MAGEISRARETKKTEDEYRGLCRRGFAMMADPKGGTQQEADKLLRRITLAAIAVGRDREAVLLREEAAAYEVRTKINPYSGERVAAEAVATDGG